MDVCSLTIGVILILIQKASKVFYRHSPSLRQRSIAIANVVENKLVSYVEGKNINIDNGCQ
jgi:hypothetical protein